jgi:hypothetical protein
MSMTKTRFVSSHARRQVRNAPNTETALFLAILAIGLALLSLFAVVALATFVELAQILPFFGLPLVLLVASALFLRRWAAGEAAAKAVQDSAHRSSKRRPPRRACKATNGPDTRQQAFRSAAVRR